MHTAFAESNAMAVLVSIVPSSAKRELQHDAATYAPVNVATVIIILVKQRRMFNTDLNRKFLRSMRLDQSDTDYRIWLAFKLTLTGAKVVRKFHDTYILLGFKYEYLPAGLI